MWFGEPFSKTHYWQLMTRYWSILDLNLAFKMKWVYHNGLQMFFWTRGSKQLNSLDKQTEVKVSLKLATII